MSLNEFYESTPRDLLVFFSARTEMYRDQENANWERTKRIMWASIASMHGGAEANKAVQLNGSSSTPNLTPFQKQELDKWNEEMDREMGIVK